MSWLNKGYINLSEIVLNHTCSVGTIRRDRVAFLAQQIWLIAVMINQTHPSFLLSYNTSCVLSFLFSGRESCQRTARARAINKMI